MNLYRKTVSSCVVAILLVGYLIPGRAQNSIESARPSIEASWDGVQWTLNAGKSSYVIGVNEQHMLQTVYWGPRLAEGAALPAAHSEPERASFDPGVMTTPLEYAAWGAGLATEPALKVDSGNGDRTLVLLYESSTIKGDVLEVTLRDAERPVLVHLFYQVYPSGIVARWSRIEDAGKQPIRVEQAASAVLNLPRDTGYALSWLTGQWGGEWQLHTAAIEPGMQVLESRRGSTSHGANPWFAIGKSAETTETAGPVWFGELGWSGSWRITVEDSALHAVRITAGYNPFDFSYTLQPGESLETPHAYVGYTEHGQGEASRILHRFQLAEILPERPDPKPRPIVYNSWEATGFNVNEAGQMALADRAAKLGAERFVMDDGWFGERDNDHAGLGDWQVNRTKFPNGLKPLIDRVHGLGMDFGLWVEPEMINPDSKLYREHPDWVMSFSGRQRTEARNQLVLNLAMPAVKDFVYGFLDKLVTENQIAFLKWDYNRNWSEPGWQSAADGDGKEIYVRYIQNLYEILDRMRKKHPGLEIESCSGGGGRTDLGILRYTDEVWPSDNTDALDRLSMQFGFTHAYSPETMVAWVTDVPNGINGRTTPLQFRFLVAMQGALGIGSNLTAWTPEQMSEAMRLTAFYKTIRTTVQHGKLYRLSSPLAGDASQVEYVASDGSQAVLLAYLQSQHYGIAYPQVRLQGLQPEAMYRIRALDAAKYAGESIVQGSVLMGYGVQLKLMGDDDSTALVLERVGSSYPVSKF
jgi:alpha-galactosidase